MSHSPSPQRARAIGMLVLANFFWSVSFPLTKAVEQLQGRLQPGSSGAFVTMAALAPRFLLGLAILLGLAWFRPQRGARATALEWKQGLIMGFFNASGMLLQIDGLRFTAASTSAFLTQFYAIMIPIWLAIRFRKNPGFIVWTCCALVLAGVALLGHFDWRAFHLGRGEIETLLGSVFFMGQILWLEDKSFAENRPEKITLVMFGAETAVFVGLALAAAPHPGAVLAPWTSLPWLGLTLLLTVLCTVLPFPIMNAWQPKIAATEAGLIYCLEPVLASLLALFLPAWISVWVGITYANERATLNLLVGGSLITLANVLIQLKPAPPA